MNRQNRLKTSAAVALAAAALSLAPQQRAAAEDIRAESVIVNYADLDLSRTADVRTLYARIVTAAGRACGDHDQRDARAMRDWRRCTEAAVAAAVARVGSDSLDALHREGRGAFAERVAAASPS